MQSTCEEVENIRSSGWSPPTLSLGCGFLCGTHDRVRSKPIVRGGRTPQGGPNNLS
jgi:hypothetical protein